MCTLGMIPYGQSCNGWGNSAPGGSQCPPKILYCQPLHPIETLFIGWNPLGPKHFWNSPQDNLRNSLAEVLYSLGWSRQSDFIQQFLKQHCYLVHAVPCWKKAKFPGRPIGNQIVSTCAKNLLQPTLMVINPTRICALGRVPHIALHHALFPSNIPVPNPKSNHGTLAHSTMRPPSLVILSASEESNGEALRFAQGDNPSVRISCGLI